MSQFAQYIKHLFSVATASAANVIVNRNVTKESFASGNVHMTSRPNKCVQVTVYVQMVPVNVKKITVAKNVHVIIL